MKTEAILIALCLTVHAGNTSRAEAPATDAPAGEEIAFRLDSGSSTLDIGFEPGGDLRLLALDEGGADQAAPAGAAEPFQRPRLGALAVHGGLGFTAGPEAFLFTVGAEYFVTSNIAVGPLFQFAFADNWDIVAPSIQGRYVFDLDAPSSEPLGRLKPFAEVGMGACYIGHTRQGDDEEWAFLINFGGGIDYFFTDNLALGTEMLFNFLPGEAQGQHFFFSWQVVTVRFLF
jgi:hypothetical protein